LTASVLLFLVAYPFTKKINAVGISNLPAALAAYRHAKSQELKHDARRRTLALLVCLLHSSTVFSALFGRYPRLIVAHSVACIALSVRDSIEARREEEEQERLKAEQGKEEQQQQERGKIASVTGRLRDWMFGSSTSEDDGDDDGDADNGTNFAAGGRGDADGDGSKGKKSKTAQAQEAVRKTKRILRGKRDSATDDVAWGAFQASFILLDHAFGKAMSYVWLLFLLTVLEEALLNPRLSRRQRTKRLLLVAATGFVCRNLVLSDFCGFWLRLGRHVLSFASPSA